jgi:ABC-type phosphate transport system permease subunit
MPTSSSVEGVTLIVHAIQLAIAPVFLLTGVGALLSVMATRLSRVIDRARRLEGNWKHLTESERASATRELGILEKRAHLASWAINFCASAALLVCAVIAALFLDVFMGTNLKWLVGTLFIFAMIALIGGLISFLREVYLATHTLRIGPPDYK